ncbi:MAG: GNAT family N-acetyltransferase, partial [Candidatus Enteromonas sp.]|nr:GNAT family N-acetyltransferase [Candidatus Enteromonas sp.]
LSLLQKADLGEESKIIVLERLMVHPSYQGRGIATSIFSYLHETMPQYDWLFAVFLNDENAIRLYRHLGYKEIGIFPDFEWGGSANECTVFVKNYHL